jgi:hypothetical protein
MKARIPPVKLVWFTLLIVSASLGAHIANMTYQHDTIVKGVLGISVIYLFSRVFWSSKKDPVEDWYNISKFTSITAQGCQKQN